MDKKFIKTKIKKILEEILDIVNLPEDASDKNIDEWDSLTYLTILTKIEDKFQIKIDENNLNHFDSYKRIVKLIINAKK